MLVFRFICGLLASAALMGCASPPRADRFDYAQVIMGVRVNIAAYCDDEAKARAAAKYAFDAMTRVDDALSDYRPESEAMRLCDAAGTGPVPVSDLLATVFRRSFEFSQASEGAFDVTAGPLARIWREARRGRTLPDPAQLASAMARVGWRKVSVHTSPDGRSAATLASPGMRLDFGAIGKGYAADVGLAAMRRAGVNRCLVAAAGDIAIGDPPPDRPGWRIEMSEGGAASSLSVDGDRAVGDRSGEVQSSPPTDATPHSFIEVTRCGVSTSGDTEQFVEINGVRYSHIVDPRTGLGVTTRVVVTVVAPDATTADAAATALCILPTDEHARFLGAFPGTHARTRLADQPAFHDSVTPGFPTVGSTP